MNGHHGQPTTKLSTNGTPALYIVTSNGTTQAVPNLSHSDDAAHGTKGSLDALPHDEQAPSTQRPTPARSSSLTSLPNASSYLDGSRDDRQSRKGGIDVAQQGDTNARGRRHDVRTTLSASTPLPSGRKASSATSLRGNASYSTATSPEALHVQQTYRRISQIGGIPRDGFVDGVELTRERRTEEDIEEYLSPNPDEGDISQFSGIKGELDRSQRSHRSHILAQSHGPVAGRSDGYTPQPMDGPGSGRRQSYPALDALQIPSGASTPSRNRQTSIADRPLLSAVTREAQEEAEKEDLRLLEKVDRYGFFEPTYTKHARLALLRKSDCLDLPDFAGLLKGKATKKRGTSHSAATLPSPYLNTDPGSTSAHSSRRSSTQPRTSLSIAPSASSVSAVSARHDAGNGGGLVNGVSGGTSNNLKESERIQKWYSEMLVPGSRDSGGNIQSWAFSPATESKYETKLRRRVFKGIPDRWRLAAWEALMERRRRSLRNGGPVANDEQLRRRFFQLTLEPCEHDVQIDLDVPRTISGHLYFHTRYGLGQRSLFNVLHAFALLCPECGYCQGMGSVAATFLCYLPPERAYTSMVHLHDVYGLHRIFQPGFPGMLECFHVQEQLVKLLMPDVHEVFDKNFISVSSFATKWYITLFVNTISFSTQLRIWDAFLLEGVDVIVVVSTAIIWSLRKHFVSPKADFESILSLLSSFFVPEDEDAFMRLVKRICKQSRLRELMDSWRAEYKRNEGTA